MTAHLFTYYIKGFKVILLSFISYLSTHSRCLFLCFEHFFELIFLSFLFFYFILLIICSIVILLVATPEITMSILDWLKSEINQCFYHHQEDVEVLGHFHWIHLLLMFYSNIVMYFGSRTSQVAQWWRILLPMQEMWVWSLGQEDLGLGRSLG